MPPKRSRLPASRGGVRGLGKGKGSTAYGRAQFRKGQGLTAQGRTHTQLTQTQIHSMEESEVSLSGKRKAACEAATSSALETEGEMVDSASVRRGFVRRELPVPAGRPAKRPRMDAGSVIEVGEPHVLNLLP